MKKKGRFFGFFDVVVSDYGFLVDFSLVLFSALDFFDTDFEGCCLVLDR